MELPEVLIFFPPAPVCCAKISRRSRPICATTFNHFHFGNSLQNERNFQITSKKQKISLMSRAFVLYPQWCSRKSMQGKEACSRLAFFFTRELPDLSFEAIFWSFEADPKVQSRSLLLMSTCVCRAPWRYFFKFRTSGHETPRRKGRQTNKGDPDTSRSRPLDV